MKSLQNVLDKLSRANYHNASHPRFSKEIDSSYSKGYIKGFTWVDEMCSHYFNLEKGLINEFKIHLEERLRKADALPPCQYKDGLVESLQNALNSL